MPSITIECKVVGRTRPLSPGWSVPIPPEWGEAGGRLTLRDLITCVVHEEVGAFEERQRQRRLIQVLTRTEIEAGARQGKIAMAGSDLAQETDSDLSAAAALRAFEDGLYFVFVDDEQQSDLDSTVYLKTDSRLTFLRLVALVGG